MSPWSVIGLLRPFALTADARTRRNSWSRRMRARSLCVLLTASSRGRSSSRPGGLYCRCRARTTWSACVPLSAMHPVVWMFRPEYESKTGSGKYIWIPPSALHDVDEAVEVELDEVLDRDPEVLFDGGDQLVGPLIQRRVDLVGPVRPRVGDEQVAGDREDRQRVVRRVQVQDHHDVAVDARSRPVSTGRRRVLHRERAARGRPDHQDVLRPRVSALRRRIREVVQADAVDLVVEIPARIPQQRRRSARARGRSSRGRSPPCAGSSASSSAPRAPVRRPPRPPRATAAAPTTAASAPPRRSDDPVRGGPRSTGLSAGSAPSAAGAATASPSAGGVSARRAVGSRVRRRPGQFVVGARICSCRPGRCRWLAPACGIRLRVLAGRLWTGGRLLRLFDLAAEVVQALVDGIVFGVRGAHGPVFRMTYDLWSRWWSTPAPPRRLRLRRPEREASLARTASEGGSHGGPPDPRPPVRTAPRRRGSPGPPHT